MKLDGVEALGLPSDGVLFLILIFLLILFIILILILLLLRPESGFGEKD